MGAGRRGKNLFESPPISLNLQRLGDIEDIEEIEEIGEIGGDCGCLGVY
jgi:hypothetical protein